MAQEIRKSLPLDVRAVVDECHKKEAVSKQHSHFAIESWQKQMNDSDLDVKEKVSLKDPYSAMRITKPAKGLPAMSILVCFPPFSMILLIRNPMLTQTMFRFDVMEQLEVDSSNVSLLFALDPGSG